MRDDAPLRDGEIPHLLRAILAELRAIRCAGPADVPSPLLLALGAYYGDGEFTSAEAEADDDADLERAIAGVGGPQQLGVALRALANRPAGGLVLVKSGRNRRNATLWRVVTDMTSGTYGGERENVDASSTHATHEGIK